MIFTIIPESKIILMRHILSAGFLLIVTGSILLAQEAIIIDHACDDLSEIPVEWINSAKNNLYIGYGHTSHGSQITSGMDAIESYYTDGTYNWSHEGGENELHLFEGAGESEGYLDYDVGYLGWDEETREYLDSFPACNVIIWSWCGQVNDVDLTTHLFEPMEQLEADFPGVQFVYMTGHLEGLGPEGSLYEANQQIRDYCTTHNKILFDFADIEKYDPDKLINYQDYYADDACDYDPDGAEPVNRTENWANNWLNSNSSDELSQISALCISCAHSVSLNCTKKGIAAWYLWARLAGSDGNNSIPVTSITITSENGSIIIPSVNNTLQLQAEVLPENATNPTIQWSVENGTGQASVSSEGLVTAIAEGTVTIIASATDGSGVSDSFEIIISDEAVLVTDINISSENGLNTIPALEGTLQLQTEVLPENATDPTIQWSVENGTGQASITSDGLVTAIAEGTATIIASANDGSGVSDSFEINILNEVVLVTDITIYSENELNTIPAPDSTLQLYVEVLPENATNPTVQWSVVNFTGQASISPNGLVTAMAPGIITITASTTDYSGVSDDFEITIEEQNPDFIYNNQSTLQFDINNRILSFDNTNEGIRQIRICNLNGQIIAAENINAEMNIITLNQLQKGLYILQFISEYGQNQNELIYLP